MSIIGSIGSTLGSWFGAIPAKLSGGSQNKASADVSGSGLTWANRAATPEQALQLAAFWACTKLIGQTVGTLPLRLYTLRPDRSRIEAFDDPLYALLQFQPNADHTGVEFWEGIAFCLAIWGNAFALKTYGSDGSLVAIELLRPFWMTVLRAPSGEPIYRYSDPLFQQVDYRAADLLHVRGFGGCDIAGLQPIQFARQTIASAIAADETAGRLFSNGMKVGGWFKYKPGNLTADQRQQTREALVEPYTGTENAFKVGILPGDFDWVPTTLTAEDAELIATRRMNIEEICRWFGVPPILIGHAGEGQTMWGTGQESIVRSFLTMGLRPLVHRIEACVSRDIIGRARRSAMKAEFDLSELVRGDTKVQGDIDAQDVNNGLRTRNEVRASRNLPPLPGGDTLTVQSALLPIEMLGKVAKLPKDKPVEPGADVAAAGMKLIEHVAEGVKSLPFDRDHSFSWEVKGAPPDLDVDDLPFFYEQDGWAWVPDDTQEVKAKGVKPKVSKAKHPAPAKEGEHAEPGKPSHKPKPANFNSDQPRDARGRWVKVGSDAHKAAIAHAAAHPKVPSKSFAHYANHDKKTDVQKWAVEQKLQADSLGARALTTGPKSERSAVMSYSGSGYYSLNDALRHGTPASKLAITKDLDAALAKTKLAESTVVFRGLKPEAIAKFPGFLKPGTVMTDPAYQSTSIKKKVAQDFAGSGYVLQIHAYKGARALPLNGAGSAKASDQTSASNTILKPPSKDKPNPLALSYFPGEHEVLLPRSTSIRVLRVEGKTIHAELLG